MSTMTTDLATMDMDTCLRELGASSELLTAQQRQDLDERGYAIFPGIIDEVWLQQLRERVEELYALEGQKGGIEVHTEGGTRRLSNLVNKGDVFDAMWAHPVILSAIHHVIARPFCLSSLNARDALPGAGNQALHCDWGKGYDGQMHVCNSIWLLDDFDAENGCTRVVPGTHLQEHPKDVLDDPTAPHPDQVLIQGPAGTVCVFSSHTWHGGTPNISTDRTRRGVHCYFTAREHKQQTVQQDYLLYNTWKRLNAAQKFILKVND